MNPRLFRGWAAVMLMVLLLSSIAVAEDAVTTTGDANIEIKKLAILVEPLTVAEIQNEINGENGWLSLVKQAGKEYAQARLGNLVKGTPADLLKIREALLERMKVLVGALAAKGGDEAEVTGYKAYMDSLAGGPMAGLEVDAKDLSGTATRLLDWAKSPDGGLKILKNIIFFILVLIAFKILAAIVGSVVRKAVGRLKNISSLLRDFFVTTTKKLTFLIGVIVALGILGIEVGPFVAAIGAVGFIIAFALQGTLSNFASGIMILLYRPYDLGDVVSVAGVLGKVDAMSLVSTTIMTPDNQVVVVPNNSIWGDVITNVTGNDTRRVDMVFGIGYGDDMDKAKTVMQGILDSHELILKDPAPVIEVHELADSSVNFVCRPWCKTSDYWKVFWGVTKQVKEQFDAESISIPFPQRDVHMISE